MPVGLFGAVPVGTDQSGGVAGLFHTAGLNLYFWSFVLPHGVLELKATAATLAIGFAGHVESPVVVITMIATLCLAQLAVSLPRARQPEAFAHAPGLGE